MERSADMNNVSVDVVIPVYRPQNDLLVLIKQLNKQTIIPRNIFIINTEKEFFNEKKFIILPNIKVTHISKAEFDHAATRQLGMNMSTAEYVLFMTMDAIPPDCCMIENLLKGIMTQDNVAVAYARQIPKKHCRLEERFTRRFNYPEQSCLKVKKDIGKLGIKAYFCSDVCAMYDHKVFDELGGFVGSAIFNEDMFYAAKALKNGYGVFYCAKARVMHSHNYTLAEQFKRNFDMGASQAMHPEIFEGISSEAEGKKLVIQTVKYLLEKKKWYRIPYFGASCVAKYAGYRLGKNYRLLPDKLIDSMTANQEFWNKYYIR